MGKVAGSVGALGFAVVTATMASAQSPITTRQLTKTEQVDAAIDLLVRLKTAVADSNKGRESEAYKRIAVQSFKCALIYGMFSKRTPSDGVNAVTYANVSVILNDVSAVLYADSMANYKSDTDAAYQEIIDLRKNEESKKTFYLLRNCSDLVEASGKTLQNAISELLLK